LLLCSCIFNFTSIVSFFCNAIIAVAVEA
jgi:hypothetical protein